MHSPTVLKSQVSLTRYVTFSTCLASPNLSALTCEMGPRPISAHCSEEGAVHTTLSTVQTRSILYRPRFSCLCR